VTPSLEAAAVLGLHRKSNWQNQQKSKSAKARRKFGKKTTVQPAEMMRSGIRPKKN
jgi:hypothetical protein